MRLTARPMSRGSGGSAVFELTAIENSRPTGPYRCRFAAAYTRDPDNLVTREHYGPMPTFGSGDACIAEKSFDLPLSSITELHAVAWLPATHRQRDVGGQQRDPGIGHRGGALRRHERESIPPNARRERAC